MAQQTAVEWLASKLKDFPHIKHSQLFKNLVNQAKEMEKEQKEECWNVAHQSGRFEGKGIAEENWQTFEQYYNETFKSE